MQPAPGPVKQAGEDVIPGEFILPDLCGGRTVFTMVLLVELLVLVYTLATSALPEFDWNTLAVYSLFVQWVVLLSAAVLCALRRFINNFGLPMVSLFCLLVVLVVTALSSLFAWHLLPMFNPGSSELWWVTRNLLMSAVLAGIAMRYFYLQHQLLVQKQLELRSRLDSLRSKIRPHFLFNTLNSIASLIASRPDDAERAVEDLSELLRVSLNENARPTTVADEKRLCDLYLAIEKMRLGEKLQVVWDMDAALAEKPMPSLLLQPLVENAVYHGVAQMEEGGKIIVHMQSLGNTLAVSVENPAPDRPARTDGHKIAMENIRQRLQVLYGSQGTLQTVNADGLYRVELSYPLWD
ncbi:MAG: histidine kinase [Pseudomonadota bacterium]